MGPASYWVDELMSLATVGVDAFIFWPGGDDPVSRAESFASEGAPAVQAV